MHKIPSKVLHLVENLDKGAVENWLVRMFEYGQSQDRNLDWTFYCVNGKPGRLDEKVLKLGGKIIYSKTSLAQKISFLKELREALVQGRYEVLHAHHDYMSAFYLIAALGLPIRLRIVHIHNSDEVIPTGRVWLRNPLIRIFRMICLQASDNIIGISRHTLADFLNGARKDPKWHFVHYYGFNYTPFLNVSQDKIAFRISLGFKENDKVVLFLSRMDKTKGPLFALEVIAEANKRDSNIKGLFVGTGSLVTDFQKQVQELNLGEVIKYLGWSDRVPEIMANSDLFILPHEEHPMEGLGLVLLEAQVAGLPLLISNGISDDPILDNAIFKRLDTQDGIGVWASALQSLIEQDSSRTQIIAEIIKSPFNMDFALNDLESIHNGREN